MTTPLLNQLKRQLRNILSMFCLLMVSNLMYAQHPSSPGTVVTLNGAQYVYLGSCTVNGQAHYYYLSNAIVTWPTANTTASALTVGGSSGYLATLTSSTENACVTSLLMARVGTNPYSSLNYANPNNPWIGYYQPTSGPEPAGGWQWVTGEQVCSNYTNWHPGEGNRTPPEPNDFMGSEDYAQLLMFDGVSALGGVTNAGTWNDWFTTNALRFIVEFGPTVCETIGQEGCTPGYWKNHTGSWAGTGLTPGQTAGSVFNLSAFPSLASQTLLQSLDGGGGPGTLGGATTLLRAAFAAMLNAAHPNVDYPLTQSQIITQVNTALASNNRNTMLALATTLDDYNNLGCSIDAHGREESARVARSPLESGVAIDKAFAISGYPNPSRAGFNVQINGLTTEKMSVRVTDATGRLVEQRANLAANQVLSVGNTYKPGLYYIEVAQGAKKQQIKMIKQ